MTLRLPLRALAQLMEWSDDQARHEFAWLRFISRLKYDGYQDYLAGVRFVECLLTWLRQFDSADRVIAYKLVRERLIFVSDAEMRRLVERLYPREIEPTLVRAAAKESSIPAYRVWAHSAAVRSFEVMRRKTLFMGLSDGSRIDVFRRANAGTISNEQTVLGPLVDHDKWRDLGSELMKDPLLAGVSEKKFTRIYLIDDLTASGTTLIRFDEQWARWKGKLAKLRDSIWSARDVLKDEFPIAETFDVCVYHYIATAKALAAARERDEQARRHYPKGQWFPSVRFAAGLELDSSATLRSPDDQEFISLCESDKYYDPVLENRHAEESGNKNMRLGYGGCALTLVLEHNTPNNSIPLLWADTTGGSGRHAMRSLFRRRSRHV